METDLSLLLDSLPGLVWTALSDGRAEYVGRQWLDYTGLSFEEASGAGWTTALHPDDAPSLLAEWAKIIASGQLGEAEARLRRRDGVYRWFLFRASPMREPTGDVRRWSGMNIDIDDRVQADAVLRHHQNRIERIFDALPVIAGLFSPAGKIISCNRRMLDFLGMTFEDVRAKPSAFDHHLDDQEETMAAWWAAVAAGQPFDHVARLKRWDGAYVWHRLVVDPLRNSAGEIEVLYGVASDIDVQVRAEAALAGEKRLLQMVATGTPLTEVLDAVCREVEALTPESRCGVLLVGPDRKHFKFGAGPSIPEGYRLACDGVPIDPKSGPCALAVVSKKPVISTHIMEDERWASSPLLPVVAVNGLAACWSMPILISNDEAAGDLTVYRAKPSSADATDLELIDRFVHIAGIAIERARADEALQASEATLAAEKRLLEKVARGVALPVVLDELARTVEALVPGCFCTILIVDEGREHFKLGAAPTLPDDYKALLDGKDIDPGFGPLSRCIFEKSPIIVGDVANDPRWANSAWPARMMAHGLHSSWTAPILAADGASLAAFAIYRREPQIPTPHELELIDRFTHIAGIAIERAQADATLRASQAELLQAHAHLNEAQQLSRTGSFTWDVERDEHNWSPEQHRMWEFGPDVKISMSMILEAVHPDDLPLAERVIGGALHDSSFELVLRIITKSGALKHLHLVGRRVEDIADRPVFLGAIQDITERKLAEEALNDARAELAHVSRAMTLSALTASIAHEVNQPLAGIITNSSTGLRMLAADPPNLEGLRATLQRTLRDGNRASEVIQRLRAMFARRGPGREFVDLNDATREVLALSEGELRRRRVAVSTDFAEPMPPLCGDRVQLQQVILNLVLNAADAMTVVDDRQRSLRISTQPAGSSEVTLSVQDSGIGLEPDSVERVFSPFYTTKSDGMGIGLAISRTIIESHEGRLWAAQNEGRPGATFSFTIPVTAVS